jgi:hypothetical protein
VSNEFFFAPINVQLIMNKNILSQASYMPKKSSKLYQKTNDLVFSRHQAKLITEEEELEEMHQLRATKRFSAKKSTVV